MLYNDTRNARIIAGELDIVVNSGLEQVRKIKDHLIHPDWDGFSDNGICLFTLETPLELNENVQGIELDDHDPLDSTTCEVSGWGYDHWLPNQTLPTILQWTEVNVGSDSYCHAINGVLYNSSNMICTSTPVSCLIQSLLFIIFKVIWLQEKDVCVNDDGGPLVFDGKLTGIATYVACGPSKYASTYAKVEPYVEWIKENAADDDDFITTTEDITTTDQETTTNLVTTTDQETTTNQVTTTAEGTTSPNTGSSVYSCNLVIMVAWQMMAFIYGK